MVPPPPDEQVAEKDAEIDHLRDKLANHPLGKLKALGGEGKAGDNYRVYRGCDKSKCGENQMASPFDT